MVRNRLTKGTLLSMLLTIFLFSCNTGFVSIVYIFSASINESGALGRGEVWLQRLNLSAYKIVFDDQQVWIATNTIWYVVVGTGSICC